MAGSKEHETADSTFIWDQNSQLYYHHSSGFYHDPVAGWYYSTKDGFYYKFENGNYVLLQTNYGSDCGKHSDFIVEDECHAGVEAEKTVEEETREVGCVSDRPAADDLMFVDNQMPQNLPPPSEWWGSLLYLQSLVWSFMEV